MGFWLIDHPNPFYPQTRPRSAWGWSKPTGLVTVHVAVSALDAIAPDTGAENVAGYISIRKDPGGYHSLHDSDSSIAMAPDELMTWHTAAMSLNGPGWGVCAACGPDDWDPDSAWTQRTIARMGKAICEFWQRWDIDVVKAARWTTYEEVQATGGRIAGLVHHGVVQPGDRYDAWVKLTNGRPHPHRARLDRMLVDAILAANNGTDPAPPPITEEDIMASRAELQADLKAEADRIIGALRQVDNTFLATHQGENRVYLVLDGVKRHIPEAWMPAVLEKYFGADNRGIQDAALNALPTAEWDDFLEAV